MVSARKEFISVAILIPVCTLAVLSQTIKKFDNFSKASELALALQLKTFQTTFQLSSMSALDFQIQVQTCIYDHIFVCSFTSVPIRSARQPVFNNIIQFSINNFFLCHVYSDCMWAMIRSTICCSSKAFVVLLALISLFSTMLLRLTLFEWNGRFWLDSHSFGKKRS